MLKILLVFFIILATVIFLLDIDIHSKSRLNSLATGRPTATNTLIICNANAMSMKFDISIGISINTTKLVMLSYTFL